MTTTNSNDIQYTLSEIGGNDWAVSLAAPGTSDPAVLEMARDIAGSRVAQGLHTRGRGDYEVLADGRRIGYLLARGERGVMDAELPGSRRVASRIAEILAEEAELAADILEAARS